MNRQALQNTAAVSSIISGILTLVTVVLQFFVQDTSLQSLITISVLGAALLLSMSFNYYVNRLENRYVEKNALLKEERDRIKRESNLLQGKIKQLTEELRLMVDNYDKLQYKSINIDSLEKIAKNAHKCIGKIYEKGLKRKKKNLIDPNLFRENVVSIVDQIKKMIDDLTSSSCGVFLIKIDKSDNDYDKNVPENGKNGIDLAVIACDGDTYDKRNHVQMSKRKFNSKMVSPLDYMLSNYEHLTELFHNDLNNFDKDHPITFNNSYNRSWKKFYKSALVIMLHDKIDNRYPEGFLWIDSMDPCFKQEHIDFLKSICSMLYLVNATINEYHKTKSYDS